MAKKRTWTEEQKASLLKEADANGLAETLRKHGIFPATYYGWKKKFDAQGLAGLKPQYSKKQMKEFRDLEQENALLKKLLAEKELELAMAKEDIKKNLAARQAGRP
jgi:putative transposase